VHAKQRPRNAGGHTYTPPATKAAEKIIKDNFELCLPDHDPFDGPIRVSIAMSNDNVGLRIVETEPHTQKKLRGDIDNYAKTILDALNGVAWVDDKQIERLWVVKL
jgi:Holliday junction resolvase RusA-like endonuclease